MSLSVSLRKSKQGPVVHRDEYCTPICSDSGYTVCICILPLTIGPQALHLNPHDKAILYNIAMIMQKAAEMMFSLPPGKRQIKDLQQAIDQGSRAQKWGFLSLSVSFCFSLCCRLFASLASAPAAMLPYSRELADQRRKYGDNMLRKAEEHMNGQKVFEAEKAEKLEIARRKRQEEKDKQEAAEVCFCYIVLLRRSLT